jgi:hypothetical protein
LRNDKPWPRYDYDSVGVAAILLPERHKASHPLTLSQ